MPLLGSKIGLVEGSIGAIGIGKGHPAERVSRRHVTPLLGASSSPCCIPLLPRINDHLVRWTMRKYKRLRRREKRARLFLSGRRSTDAWQAIYSGRCLAANNAAWVRRCSPSLSSRLDT
jgi:hypothetical protein